MQQNRSIWLASTKSIAQYRKFRSSLVLKDVKNDLDRYTSFDGLDRNIIVDRIFNSIKQSLRVRGINWLTKMRKSFMSYENKITEQIKHLEEEMIRNKKLLREHWPDLEDPNTSVNNVIRYYKLRENYLKSKIKLESLILHRKNIKKHLATSADDILMEK